MLDRGYKDEVALRERKNKYIQKEWEDNEEQVKIIRAENNDTSRKYARAGRRKGFQTKKRNNE